VADELDFTGSLKLPQPAAPAAAPIYVPAIARAFFESAGKEESFAAGTVIFAENEKASRILLKRDKMYYLVEGQVVAKLLATGLVGLPLVYLVRRLVAERPPAAQAALEAA